MDETARDPAEWSPCHDRRGIPICAGDLIRSPHFMDRRGKRHYLYHVAVHEDGHWLLVPTAWLHPTKVKGGGRCVLAQHHVDAADVISGYGPGRYLDALDRPRVKGGTT